VDAYRVPTSLFASVIALVQNLQPFWQRKINLVLTLSLELKKASMQYCIAFSLEKMPLEHCRASGT